MADKTFGQVLFEHHLPEDVNLEGPVDKRALSKAMTAYAKKNPDKYPDVIQKIKKFGDYVATYEGISVGLDDIQPEYTKRDAIMQGALKRVKATDDPNKRREIILETQSKILELAKEHPSDMALMARSGGRGSMPQLMKMVGSPVAASNSDGEVIPWLITRSYSEGLDPAETWVAGIEARNNAYLSTGSVVEPGAVAKVIVSNMEDIVVTDADCGTQSGLRKSIDDEAVIDRYLAKPAGNFPRDTLVDARVVEALEDAKITHIYVRSPMTCDVPDGVCQKCMGQDAWGKDFEIGTNAGSRSAQALSEPLTQFALNAKHGVRLAGGDKATLRGLNGFRTLTEVPKSFQRRAALARVDGVVEAIQPAPQGGHHITVQGERHYSVPGLDPIVKIGDRVETGDALTEGPPMPDEVVEAKGVGEGRRYLSDAIKDVYRRTGADIDARHTEILARKAMNYVEIEDDPTDTFIPGDVVNFNQVRRVMREHATSSTIDDAVGRYLAEPVLHYTEGTRITPSLVRTLKEQGVDTVKVSKKTAPRIKPIMKSMIQTPLLNDDWMSRMSHRYLKRTLVEGAGFGLTSDIQSTSPIPAYVASPQFGQGERGKYAHLNGAALDTSSLRDKLRAQPPRREKTANAGKVLKDILIGGGKQVASKVDPRVIGRTGAIDNTALDALRYRNYLGADTFNRLNLYDDQGYLTDLGEQRIQALQDILDRPGMRSRVGNLFKSPGERRLAKTQLTDADRARLNEAGIGDIIGDAEYNRIMQGEGGFGRRAGRLLTGTLFGERPLKIMQQRFREGGVFGRGGLFLGDLGMDPDFQRSLQRYRQGRGSLGSVAWHGGVDVMNKGMSYGLPAMGAYQAITTDAPEGESQWARVAAPVGDTLGWSIGGPFGLVGGSLLAGQIRSGIETGARKLDPSYTAPAKQQPPPRGLSGYARRTLNNAQDAFESSNIGFLAEHGQEFGGQLYNRGRQMYTQHQQHPAHTAQPRPPHMTHRAPQQPGTGAPYSAIPPR